MVFLNALRSTASKRLPLIKFRKGGAPIASQAQAHQTVCDFT